jgi:hypothetical protein
VSLFFLSIRNQTTDTHLSFESIVEDKFCKHTAS